MTQPLAWARGHKHKLATTFGGLEQEQDCGTNQKDFSSGREEPEEAALRIAAASRSWTCWCFDNNNFDASFQCCVHIEKFWISFKVDLHRTFHPVKHTAVCSYRRTRKDNRGSASVQSASDKAAAATKEKNKKV